jgi:hypothetical protein
MLHSEEFDKAKSASDTYVIPVFTGPNYSGIKFKKFKLPGEYKDVGPTWYFYNKLDLFSCGGSAFPIEMYNQLEEI